MAIKGLVVVALAASCAAAADVPGDGTKETAAGGAAIEVVNRSLSLSYLQSRLYYDEPDNNGTGVIDSERGLLRGGRVAASYMGPWDLYLRAEWSGQEGRVDYEAYPPINPRRVSATSRDTMQDGGLKLGKGFPLNGSWLLTPYLTGGRSYRVREIALGTPSDFIESFSFYYIGLGSLVQCSPWSRWVFTGDVALEKMLDPWITVNRPSVGLNQTALGTSPVVRLGLEADYRATSFLHLFTGLGYTYFTLGQSDEQSTGFFQPFGRTELYELSLGLRLTFDGLRASMITR